MKQIKEQIKIFLSASQATQAELSRESGVKEAFFSRLRSGKQNDIMSAKADAIREAMTRMDSLAAQKAGVVA